MVYFSVFDLSQKDKETMLKSLEKESYKEIVRNMEYLDVQIAVAAKFKRRYPEMTQEEFNEYLRKHSQAKFDILKCDPKIVKLLKQMYTGTLDSSVYPFAGELPKKSGRRMGEELLRGAASQ